MVKLLTAHRWESFRYSLMQCAGRKKITKLARNGCLLIGIEMKYQGTEADASNLKGHPKMESRLVLFP